MVPTGPSASTPTSAPARALAPAPEVVLEILDGCAELAAQEASVLGPVRIVGPTEAVVDTDDLTGAAALRRSVAAYLCIRIPARRPQELLETSVMRHLGQALQRLQQLRPRSARFTGLRLAAAGAGTPVMERLAQELAAAVDLPVDAEDGDLLVRVRPAARTEGAPRAWEVLARLTPRPLSTRAWRTVDYPGAVNATIAACVMTLMDISGEDELLDMTCGSGTLLIEQSFLAAPRRAVGVDLAPAAIEAARAHQRSARRKGRIDWIVGDVLTADLPGGFTRIVANPPWGEIHGEHATNQDLLASLLARADELGAPGCRVGILTHEIRRMHAVLADPACAWTAVDEHRFFQKGHHPRLFRLRRRDEP